MKAKIFVDQHAGTKSLWCVNSVLDRDPPHLLEGCRLPMFAYNTRLLTLKPGPGRKHVTTHHSWYQQIKEGLKSWAHTSHIGTWLYVQQGLLNQAHIRFTEPNLPTYSQCASAEISGVREVQVNTELVLLYFTYIFKAAWLRMVLSSFITWIHMFLLM